MRKLIRDNVLKIEYYEPGMPEEVLKKAAGMKFEISRLASNENPLGPSPLAVKAVKECLGSGHLYPDNSCNLLKKKIARYLGISTDSLCIGNGTTELILLIGIAFLNPRDSLIMSESSFIMAKIISQVMDSRLIEVPLKNYRHDLESILTNITPDTKIVYLDNPMNPIGTMLTQQEVAGFMKKMPEDVLVIFDEAYYEYAQKKNYPHTLKFIEEGRNVAVLRTFSKLYGLAGFRVGYCATKKNFVDAIKRVSPPFSVSRFAQVAAAAALEDRKHMRRTKEMNESGKLFLYKNFERMSVFYIPSETNFVTIDVKRDSKDIFEGLLKKGIIVRPLKMYGKPTFLRVTVGSQEQNQRFVDAFQELYQKYT